MSAIKTQVGAPDQAHATSFEPTASIVATDVQEAIEAVVSLASTLYQPLDADLTTWAGLSPSADAQSLVTAANYAAMRALLDLEAGTDFYSIAAADAAFQPLDADLTLLASALTVGALPRSGAANSLYYTTATNYAGMAIEGSSSGVGGPILELYHNSATPAINDEVGTVTFVGKSDAGNLRYYAYIKTYISDATNASEDGAIKFFTSVAGTAAARVVLDSDLYSETDGAVNLGKAGNAFGGLWLKSTGTLTFGSSDWAAAHSTGVLTVGTGDLRVTTAGTNSASVATVGGTQTLLAKTFNLTSNTLSGTKAQFNTACSDGDFLYTDAIGVTVQAHDADLASWAGVTRASGFDTFAATPSLANLGALLTDEAAGLITFMTTPSSANLAALVTGETGSGALVFGTSPTFTDSITITADTAVTNAVNTVATLTSTSSGTPAAGIGTGQAFVVETSAGNNETIGRLDAFATDVTAAAEYSGMRLWGMAAGAAATEMCRVYQDARGVAFGIGTGAANTLNDGGVEYKRDRAGNTYFLCNNPNAGASRSGYAMRSDLGGATINAALWLNGSGASDYAGANSLNFFVLGAYPVGFVTNNTLRCMIDGSNPKFYIGDTADANVTAGLVLNQGANDDFIASFKSSDVAHGVTNSAETDTYGAISKFSATGGGVRLNGFAEDGSITGVGFTAVGDTTTTKTTGGQGIVSFDCYMNDTTATAATPAANSNLLVVRSATTTRFILDADGDSHQDVGTAWTNFDFLDDIATLNAVAYHVARDDDPIKDKFRDWTLTKRERLEELGLASFDKDGRPFMNMSKLAMLNTGAIRQLGEQLHERDSKIEALERRLMAIENKGKE